MIAFIICNSSLVPLLEGLRSANPCRFGFSVFRVFAGKTVQRLQNLYVFVLCESKKQIDTRHMKMIYF